MDQEDYYKKGIKEGIKEGIEQRTKEMIINMHNKNISVDIISECTNLTIDEINKIINE